MTAPKLHLLPLLPTHPNTNQCKVHVADDTGTTALSIPSKNGIGPMKYRKSKGEYPPSGIYGELLGDDQIQKNWPGLTCERSDDDKWEWGNSAVQKDQSGTNCLWGDTDYCLDMMENPSYRKNNIAWNICNSTCNYTDVDLVRRRPCISSAAR